MKTTLKQRKAVNSRHRIRRFNKNTNHIDRLNATGSRFCFYTRPLKAMDKIKTMLNNPKKYLQ